jgi:hypothetical protein
MNYLTVDVYRSAGIDCTNNGVTSETSPTFVVPCEHGPISGDWADEQEYVILVPGTAGNRMHMKPLKHIFSHTMFGGNFVYTTDSRFKELYGARPIHVHDRIEN